ncbi:type IV pilus biogenesis/stability protein PilW [Gilvimarinus sp. F26214L]|uniref:type IV pilus biogenesis/stability protein PilW n=1 Tax=Gilvimarinus sp. DZF01 TaxID=3461371 RepID=UPI00404636EF
MSALASQFTTMKKLIVLLFIFSLSGCVTTMEGSAQADLDSALETYVQLGMGYLRAGNRDSARLNFNKALDIDSGSPGAHDGMALLYQLEAMDDLAEKHFRKAIRSDRNFSRARNNYGSFLYEKGRYEDAYEQFERAASNLSYNRRPIALVNQGRTALKLGEVERAESVFLHALALDPKRTSAMVELADIYFKQENYPEAKKYIDMYGQNTRHSPRTLWLGIRLERIFGNKDQEASYALALKNLHPYSQEYLQYKQSLSR